MPMPNAGGFSLSNASQQGESSTSTSISAVVVDNDPLAALMAPPPLRNIAPSSGQMNDDPLASLMAPPSSRYNAFARPPAPSSSATAPPVKFNVWTPPVSTFTPSPAPTPTPSVHPLEARNENIVSSGDILNPTATASYSGSTQQHTEGGLSEISLN